MKDLISNNAKFVLDYGQYIIGLIILLVALGVFRMLRRQKTFMPKGILSWLASLVAIFLIFIGVVAIIGLQGEKETTGKVLDKFETMVMREAPPLNFNTVIEDKLTSLEAHKGKVILFNLWATWCAPCLKEFPDLEELRKEFEDEGLLIITLSDEKRAKLLNWHEKNEYGFLSVYKENIDWLDIPIGTARPLTFLIDKDGVIKEYVTGARTFKFWEPRIRELL